MRYSIISAAILALASSVFAQTAGFDAITSPSQGQNVVAGSSLDIIWQPGSQTGTITITLLQGSSPAFLSPGQTVASSIDNTLGKYTWSVPSSLSSDSTYGFQITLDSAPTTFQYSFPFQITGGSANGSSSASSATGSTLVYSATTSASSAATIISTNSTSISSATSSSFPSYFPTGVVPNNTIGSAPTISTVTSSFKSSSTGSTASKTSSSGSTTTSAAATQPSNDAISNMATSGFTMLGALMFSMAMIL